MPAAMTTSQPTQSAARRLGLRRASPSRQRQQAPATKDRCWRYRPTTPAAARRHQRRPRETDRQRKQQVAAKAGGERQLLFTEQTRAATSDAKANPRAHASGRPPLKLAANFPLKPNSVHPLSTPPAGSRQRLRQAPAPLRAQPAARRHSPTRAAPPPPTAETASRGRLRRAQPPSKRQRSNAVTSDDQAQCQRQCMQWIAARADGDSRLHATISSSLAPAPAAARRQNRRRAQPPRKPKRPPNSTVCGERHPPAHPSSRPPSMRARYV